MDIAVHLLNVANITLGGASPALGNVPRGQAGLWISSDAGTGNGPLLIQNNHFARGFDKTRHKSSSYQMPLPPNGNGHNDLFRVKNPQLVQSFSMIIFDRWGARVFESTDPYKGWDWSLGRSSRIWLYLRLDHQLYGHHGRQ
jgi:gliding motility-associated-like protein